MTHPLSARSLALLGTASCLTLLLLHQPAQAHGIAHGGVAAGFLHPITGVDHLLLLVAVGAASSCLSWQLQAWGLAGAIGGGIYGAFGGTLPGQELLAALAICAIAGLALRGADSPRTLQPGLWAALVAAAMAVHAMLHGLEAPADGSAASWWLGAFAGSVLVMGSSFLVLRRLPLAWSRGVGLLLALLGGVVALGPLGLLAR